MFSDLDIRLSLSALRQSPSHKVHLCPNVMRELEEEWDKVTSERQEGIPLYGPNLAGGWVKWGDPRL